MCLKAFQVPPNTRASLTAMLPTYMRGTVKPTGPLTQVNPLRIGSCSSLIGSPTFGALPSSENETKGFASLKSSTKISEEVIEKTEVRFQIVCCRYIKVKYLLLFTEISKTTKGSM